MRPLASLLLVAVLLAAPAVEAGVICTRLCQCACNQHGRCYGKQLRRAKKLCRRACNQVNRFCGDLCAVGAGFEFLDCKDGLNVESCDEFRAAVGCDVR